MCVGVCVYGRVHNVFVLIKEIKDLECISKMMTVKLWGGLSVHLPIYFLCYVV